MQVNRPHQPAPAYDNKQGSSPAAPPARAAQPRIYAPPPPPPPPPPPVAKTPAPTPQSAEGNKEKGSTDPKTGANTEQKSETTPEPKVGTTTESKPGVTNEPHVVPLSARDGAQTQHTRVTRAIRDPQAANTIEGSTGDSKETGQKDVTPDLANPSLDSFAQQHRTQVVTPHNVASDALKTWGQSQGLKDFDPDTSEVVTLDNQPEKVGSSTYVAKPTSRQSLTHAVLSNWRDPNKPVVEMIFGDRPFEKSPDFKPTDKIEDRSSFGWNSDGIAHFTGIYRPGGVYNADTQLPIKPSDLERIASSTSSTIRGQLKDYWSTHEKDYRHLSKMSALKASELQQSEGSLSKPGRDLVYRGSGVDPERRWSELTPQDIRQQQGPAAGVEVSPLSIYGYRSPDARIFHDVGDKKTDKRLLYVPGNSSPWHEFDNDAAGTSEDKLRDWVVAQSKTPQTREALASHFSQADRHSGNFRAGVDTALSGIATYPRLYHAPEQGFTGGPDLWQPRDIVSTGASDSGEQPIPGDVYDDLAGRQRLRGNQEAALTPSNASVGWKQGLDLTTQALNYVAPLALAFPELEIPLVLDGLAEIGTGISEVATDTGAQQSEGLGRISFGLLNAAPIVGGRLGAALGKEGKLPEIPSNKTESSNPFPSRVVERTPQESDLPLQETTKTVDSPPSSDPKPSPSPTPTSTLMPTPEPAPTGPFDAYRSPYSTAGRTPDDEGVYHIESLPYVPLGKATPGLDQPLYRVRKDISGDVELVKPGEDRSRYAPLVAWNKEDGSFQAVDGRLKGGGPWTRLKNKTLAPFRTADENMARTVFEEVRTAYGKGLKSSNKTYNMDVDKDDIYDARQVKASTKLREIRAKNDKNLKDGVVVPEEEKMIIDAANCSELARATAKRVLEKGGYAEVWSMDADADHAFAVVGHPPASDTVNFSDWQGVWIVDPWTNIVTEAPKYIQKLNEKMNKWAASGKLIREAGLVEMSPTEPGWLNSINTGEKHRLESPTSAQPNPWQYLTTHV